MSKGSIDSAGRCVTDLPSKAKLGFCWQFITLAGFHCDALSIDLFAKAWGGGGAVGGFKRDGSLLKCGEIRVA